MKELIKRYRVTGVVPLYPIFGAHSAETPSYHLLEGGRTFSLQSVSCLQFGPGFLKSVVVGTVEGVLDIPSSDVEHLVAHPNGTFDKQQQCGLLGGKLDLPHESHLHECVLHCMGHDEISGLLKSNLAQLHALVQQRGCSPRGTYAKFVR